MAPNRVWEIAFEAPTATSTTARPPRRPQSPPATTASTSAGGSAAAFHAQERPAPARTHRSPRRARHDLGTPPHSIEQTPQIARDYVSPPRTPRPRGRSNTTASTWAAGWPTAAKEARQPALPYCYQRALNEIYPWWNAKGEATGTTPTPRPTPPRATTTSTSPTRTLTPYRTAAHPLAGRTDRQPHPTRALPAPPPGRPSHRAPPGPAAAPSPQLLTMGLRSRTAGRLRLSSPPPSPGRSLQLHLRRRPRIRPGKVARRKTARPANPLPGTTGRPGSPRHALDFTPPAQHNLNHRAHQQTTGVLRHHDDTAPLTRPAVCLQHRPHLRSPPHRYRSTA